MANHVKPNGMKTLFYGLCLPIALVGAMAFGADPQDGDARIREFDLKTIEMLGRQIFEQDGYASRATDILLEKVGGSDVLVKQNIRGWIVVKQGKTVVVRFVKEDGGSWRPAYDVAFESPKKGAVKEVNGETFSKDELAQFNARQLAIKNIPKAYSRAYNTVVLPDPAGKGFLVYMLAATTDANKIIVGGHYRFSISETGEKILKTDQLFKSFLVVDKHPADVPKDAEVEAYTVTHLVSELPLETHVFLSLLHEKPFVVTTPTGTIWVVNGDSIAKVDSDSENKHNTEKE